MSNQSKCLASVVLVSLLVGCVTEKQTPKSSVPATTNDNGPLRFVVHYPASLHSNPISARVLLFLSKSENREPRFASDFFNLQPVYAIDATNLPPGERLVFSSDKFKAPDSLAFPLPLDRLEPGTYWAQALIDLDDRGRDFASGAGNLYSRVAKCQISGGRGGTIELLTDKVVKEQKQTDTDWVKLVEIRSELLSKFHGRETKVRAAVILPSTYVTNSSAHFPALYVIPGFGGRHSSAWQWINGPQGQKWKNGEVPLQMLRVVLDPDVPLGHSVFANSDNNGPVGDALVQELIPEIEKRFRAIPEPSARFVTGHSSGGWSSLWLQVAYPDFFGGCWSTAPDPVDFRAFQTMNIYQDRNGHWTPEGYPRPVARNGERVVLTFQRLNRWEYVTGYGGQLDSFDAVFSPRGENGKPKQIMDKLIGTISPEVAKHWKNYDIRLLLEEKWAEIGPKLKGKIHVIAGGWDTFYLEPAVELLRDFLEKTDYGGYVEIHPGDHGSVMTEPLRERIQKEIAEQFQRGRKAN